MTRINVYSQPGEDDCYAKAELIGWFDPDTAEVFGQGQRWDGQNMVGTVTGTEVTIECLYRTKGGRWVRHHDARNYFNGPCIYEFITDEQAQDWLLRSQCNDKAIRRFFGEVAEEEDRRPGRPAIGEPVNVRLGELLGRVDAYAAEHGMSRGAAVRDLVAAGLGR